MQKQFFYSIAVIGFLSFFLIGIRTTFAQQAQSLDEWSAVCLWCQPDVSTLTHHSTAVDADGNLHLVYGDSSLYYLRQTPSGERERTVVSADGGANAVLALTAAGRPHIVAYQTGSGTLYHSWQTATGWEEEVITTFSTVVAEQLEQLQPTLLIDNTGHIHLTYYDATAQTVRYGIRTDAFWSFSVAAEVEGLVSLTLALDQYNAPRIAYTTDNQSDCILFVEKNEDVWQPNFLGEVLPICQSETAELTAVSLAYDADNQPHLAYPAQTAVNESSESIEGTANKDVNASIIEIAHFDGQSWLTTPSFTTAMSETLQAKMLDLQFDAAGTPWLAMAGQLASTAAPIDHAYIITPNNDDKTEASWTAVSLAASAQVVFADLSLAADGRPVVTTFANGEIAVWQPDSDNEGWQMTAIEQAAGDMEDIELIIDENDVVHLAFHDADWGRMFYGAADESGWQFSQIAGYPAEGETVGSIALGIDDTQNPLLLFQSGNSNYQLHCLTQTDAWATCDPPWENAITLETSKRNLDLLTTADNVIAVGDGISQMSDGTWTPYNPENTDNISAVLFSAAAIDSQGNIHRLMQPNDEDTAVSYLREEPELINIIAPMPTEIAWVEVAIDEQNVPIFIGYSSPDSDLMQARWDEQTETWDISLLWQGSISDVAVTPSLQPLHIAFFEAQTSAIHLLKRTGGAWQSILVAADTQAQEIAVTVDKQGAPTIAYRHVENGDVYVITATQTAIVTPLAATLTEIAISSNNLSYIVYGGFSSTLLFLGLTRKHGRL